MVRQPQVDLYCEDEGHELFVRELILRLAREIGLRPSIHTRSGRGGHGRAVAEFKLWQQAVRKGLTKARPDLLILVIDGNCSDWRTMLSELEKLIDPSLFPRWVVGCPEPHIERWCLADPRGFRRVVGQTPPTDPGKCERSFYKRLLRQAAMDADLVIVTDEMELAPDFVRAMDLYKAGKTQRALGHFVDAVKTALQSLIATSSHRSDE